MVSPLHMHPPPTISKSNTTDNGDGVGEKAKIAIQEEHQRQAKVALETRRLGSEREQQQKTGQSSGG